MALSILFVVLRFEQARLFSHGAFPALAGFVVECEKRPPQAKGQNRKCHTN